MPHTFSWPPWPPNTWPRCYLNSASRGSAPGCAESPVNCGERTAVVAPDTISRSRDITAHIGFL
ncbi:hypothetical protein GCM10023263_92110 [Phytohabitans rumicis]